MAPNLCKTPYHPLFKCNKVEEEELQWSLNSLKSVGNFSFQTIETEFPF